MGDVQILGVISRDAEELRLAYLDEALPATPETLDLAAPLDPSQVFRLSACRRAVKRKSARISIASIASSRCGLQKCSPK
jgi:hypothetical protein